MSLIRLARSNAVIRTAGNIAEVAIFGSAIRERIAKQILRLHYKSVYRRWWGWQVQGEPHFSLHSQLLFRVFEGTAGDGLYSLSRAFYVADVIADGDFVLDIGCGDGSFTKRFYGPRAAHVDGVDIESSAITYANRHNAAANINYHRLDATRDPFPRSRYDVIVFDGAIGHFSAEGAAIVLRKIAGALAPGGLFCGSESLGREGADHLQYFETEDDLRRLLKSAFAHTDLKTTKYAFAGGKGTRHEAFWRCSQSEERLASLQWT